MHRQSYYIVELNQIKLKINIILLSNMNKYLRKLPLFNIKLLNR